MNVSITSIQMLYFADMVRTIKPITLLFTIVLFVMGCSTSFRSVDRKEVFPEDYVGTWKGELTIRRGAEVVDRLPMKLKIGEDIEGVRAWTIQYGTDPVDGLRPYLLRTADLPSGKFVIDEQNGIRLPADLHGNRLISLYEVMGTMIEAEYQFLGDLIEFKVMVTRPEPTGMTGDTIMINDTVPPVNIYPVVLTQQAQLKRK